MKLPLKLIASLVILSLVTIFAYQTYWLTGVYSTMKSEMERDIVEAMRMSDYNEMMLRIKNMREDSQEHGTITVSAGYDSKGDTALVKSSTVIHKSQDEDSTKEELESSMLQAKGGLDLILKDKNSHCPFGNQRRRPRV